MSYDNNDLGYDVGYDSDWVRPSKHTSTQNFQSEQNQVVYWAIDPATAGAAQKGVYIPLDQPKPNEAKDETKQSILLGVLEGGKNDGQLLIQDRDTGKSALISKDIAGDYGIGEGDISAAKKIPATNFAAGQPGLGDVEKKKGPNDAPVPSGNGAATNPAKIADEAKAARWKQDGDLYQRAAAYGLKDDAIKELSLWSKDKSPQEIDEKLPPAKPYDDKNPKEKKTELDRREKVKASLSVDSAKGFKTQQSDSLYKRFNTKADGSEKKPGDAGYVSREDCEAMIVQRYKMGDPSVDIDDPKVDINKMTPKKAEVDGWISSVPKGSEKGVTEEKIEGGKDKFSSKEVYDRALASERGKATDLIKKDFKEKDVNPQLFLAEKGATSAGQIRKWRTENEANRKDPVYLKDQQAQIKTFESGVDPKTSEGQAKRKELSDKIGVVEKPKFTGKAKEQYETTQAQNEAMDPYKDKDSQRAIDQAKTIALNADEINDKSDIRKRERDEAADKGYKLELKKDEEERSLKNQKKFAGFQMAFQEAFKIAGETRQLAYNASNKSLEGMYRESDKSTKPHEVILQGLFNSMKNK